MISVPVTQESVINTVKQLPRMPRDGGLIGVNLKRKMAYSNNHKKEYVDPKKMIKVLQHLQKSGHPHYQFNDNLDLEEYEQVQVQGTRQDRS